MAEVEIRRAGRADAARLNGALAALSRDLGDEHRASDADILAGGFGPYPSFVALLAERHDTVVGATVFSPVFSTTRGGAGLFVSDLWVAQDFRRVGLGRRLLAAASDTADALWGARFLKLGVYHANQDALAAYERLGFTPLKDGIGLIVEGDAYRNLRSCR